MYIDIIIRHDLGIVEEKLDREILFGSYISFFLSRSREVC